MCKMRVLVTLLTLLFCTYEDLRYRQINLLILITGAIGCFLASPHGQSVFAIFLGCIPGIAILALAHITDGIGDGDGYVFLFLGAATGLMNTVNIMIISFFIAGIFALILLIKNRIINKQEAFGSFALVPFILIGTFICLLGQ